mgnify:CR=1 FL=1
MYLVGCTFKLNKFQSHCTDRLRVQLSVGLEHLFSGLLDLKFEKDKYVLVKHLYMIDSLQVFSYTHFVLITRLL